MRHLVSSLLALVLLSALTACQAPAPELTEGQKAEIAAQVNAANADFWDAWREGDEATGVSYYYDSPEMTFTMNGEMIRGFDAVLEVTESTYADIASQVIVFSESFTHVLAPDMVYITEKAVYTVTDSAGDTGPDVGFAFTSLWRLLDGEWKIHFAHYSNPPA